jgi:hypothetical protein
MCEGCKRKRCICVRLQEEQVSGVCVRCTDEVPGALAAHTKPSTPHRLGFRV